MKKKHLGKSKKGKVKSTKEQKARKKAMIDPKSHW